MSDESRSLSGVVLLIPEITEKMVLAGCDALETWHRYNSDVETPRDAIMEIWLAIWKANRG